MRKIIDRMKNKDGFTLAELLIVVAIIAVLVAIAIPIFTTQLERSREATDLANIRAAYAEASVAALTSNGADGTATSAAMTQQSGWTAVDAHIAGVATAIPAVGRGQTVTVTVAAADGSVSFTVNGTVTP